jgi:large subunit ribosomal protein L11
MEYKIKLNIYIRSKSAEAVPPLGTTLGNIGVNALKFCKEFNEFTQDLPNYFLLRVEILVTENKSYTFTVSLPPIGFLIYMLKKEEIIKDINGYTYTIAYIELEDLLKLAKFIFPTYDLIKSIKIIKGSL